MRPLHSDRTWQNQANNARRNGGGLDEVDALAAPKPPTPGQRAKLILRNTLGHLGNHSVERDLEVLLHAQAAAPQEGYQVSSPCSSAPAVGLPLQVCCGMLDHQVGVVRAVPALPLVLCGPRKRGGRVLRHHALLLERRDPIGLLLQGQCARKGGELVLGDGTHLGQSPRHRLQHAQGKAPFGRGTRNGRADSKLELFQLRRPIRQDAAVEQLQEAVVMAAIPSAIGTPRAQLLLACGGAFATKPVQHHIDPTIAVASRRQGG